MEKITFFKPAYDKRNPIDPSKNYGIHCVECLMVLKGPEGAVHFIFGTGMYLPETMQEYAKSGQLNPTPIGISDDHYFILNAPMGYDVGYHAPTPHFEGQELRWPTKMRKTGDGPLDIVFDKIGDAAPVCEYLGVPCYSDGSALRAEEWMNIFLREGSTKIWELLQAEYDGLFNL